MPSIVWTKSDPLTVIANLQAESDGLKETVTGIVSDVVYEAAQEQAKILEDAVTRTGIARAARGGLPGRHETGHMINQISNEVQVDEDHIVGTWGWDDPEGYFEEQDWGGERIPAAHSLLGSFISAEEKVKRRIRDAVKGS